ncbi:hypothetical protein [Acidaminobacter hydrogenoformans]|uniref:Uncharacterized protein n=1 Tax=Acidaminobacter hydrogenoformans DSM 2784 TaxID=1120920 RepID=A0A1G5RTE8_9FIRM|nr:hypothetical protein [Acidaminobacter hydrogenoformans]SCZ77395.1 hypothetical protein SAMN03080599_00761 [Acidaminobacter hydrogenoformans DSM 2784]
MKGYIVLNNGMVVNGTFEGKTANVLGSLSFANDGSISIHCDSNGSCVTVHKASSPSEASASSNGDFFTESFDLLASKVNSGQAKLAKLVIDDLPLDYHLYDVKTFLVESQLIAS